MTIVHQASVITQIVLAHVVLRWFAPQEFVLKTESERLAKSNDHASKCQKILKELLRAYDIDAQLGAER